jgi:SAM-dependent methyltransferase
MIELGCGGGTVSFQLLRYGFIDKSVLVDFSNKIRDHVEKVIDVEGFNAEFKKANVLEFRSKEKFDIVYSGGLLDHFDGKRLDSVFKKHVGLCKKGGCIVTVVPYNSRLMKMVSEMKDIPESKLRYKLFEHEEIQEFYKKNKLDIIYHARHAVSIRPHIVNKRSLEERLDNWPLVLIHNIGYIWKVYEFLEREFPKLCPKKLFEFISDCVLCYGMMHGDYLVTIARKTK